MTTLVFRAIISGDLQEDEFFEKPVRYSLPSPILCFPIRKGVDENHRVTDVEVDNELYEQFAKTAIDQSAFHSLNFKQNIANTYTSVYYSPSYPDFFFSFSFLLRRVVTMNSVNYTKPCGEPFERPLALAGHLRHRLGPLVQTVLCTRAVLLFNRIYCMLVRIGNRFDRLRE